MPPSRAASDRRASLPCSCPLHGHLALLTPHAGNVAHELGDGILCSGVPGLSTQHSHVFVRLDFGTVNTDRAMVRRHPDEASDGSSIYDRQWMHYTHGTPFLVLLWLYSWIRHGRYATSRAGPLSMGCNPTWDCWTYPPPTNESGGRIVLETEHELGELVLSLPGRRCDLVLHHPFQGDR